MPNIIRTGNPVTDSGTPVFSNEWQPQPDWWDIKQIFEDDIPPAGYEKMFIALVEDTNITSNFVNSPAYRTSDGKEYITISSVTHTWDPAYAKPCSLGYSTQWVIFYATTAAQQARIYITTNIRCLYLYIGKGSVTQFNISSLSNTSVNPCPIEAIEYSDEVTWDINALPSYAFSATPRFQKFEIPPQITSINTRAFQSSLGLKEIVIPETVQSVGTICFQNSAVSRIIIKGTELTTTTDAFINCFARVVEIPADFNSTITLTNLPLTKNSLLAILNNLKDLTGDTSKTLTIGPLNLTKLTTEEQEIATDKNWVLA